jgi:PAS domain S-box-containing protein
MNYRNGKEDSINWKAKYQELLDSLNIGFALVDLDENLLEVNETLLKLIGARREQIIGRNNRDFYSGADFERMREIGIPLQQEGNYQFEFFIPTASGERIPVLFNSSLNRNEQGRPESISVMITDIRQQKKIQAQLEASNRALLENRDVLEKERKKLETILFGIGDCVTIFDSDGRLLTSNQKGSKIHGKNKSPLIPLEHGNQRELKIMFEGEDRQFEGRLEAIGDRRGKIFVYVEILKDITHRVRLEQSEQELFRIKRELKRADLKSETVRMIGKSPAMQKVFDLIVRCAEVDSTILILGETGVGKELAARAIHAISDRKEKGFIAVNCGALPEALLESELFGHVKGAFTGATFERHGLFREAQGGTLFLDEIGDLSDSLQVKLLRALQEKEIRPVGGNRSFTVDVRIITATNKDLQELVNKGRFRHDLYYRIAVIPLVIPPLRERPEDILPLAEHFLKKHQKRKTNSPVVLDHSAQMALLTYSWPGNIRELENAVEHALAMANGPTISLDNLPAQNVMPTETNRGETSVSNHSQRAIEAEIRMISDTLIRYGGNKTLTAKELGISRTTLWRKITMYGLD